MTSTVSKGWGSDQIEVDTRLLCPGQAFKMGGLDAHVDGRNLHERFLPSSLTVGVFRARSGMPTAADDLAGASA